jgi:hypothetical protein
VSSSSPPLRQGKPDINGTGKLGANPANSSPLTPLVFLERAATIFGDCPSVVYHDTVFTWSQTYRRCLRLASALVSLGISGGDIVSHLWSINSANFAPPSFGHVPIDQSGGFLFMLHKQRRQN